MRWIFPKRICLLLYNSLFHSHLVYCIDAWGSASNNVLRPLEMLQKKAIRFVSNSDYLAHTSPIFKSLGLLKLRHIYFMRISIVVFKELKGINSGEPFGFTRINHAYQTRSASNDLLRLPNTPSGGISNSLIRTMAYVGPRCYNALPSNISNVNCSLSLFKRNLKNWLIFSELDVYQLVYTLRV